ncbi:MAG: CdaR family protein [Gemmatimonadota bacterium]
MNLRSALVKNWGYKLAALVIVSLLWLNLTADERQAQPVTTLLRVEVLDSAWVLVDVPADVSTTFQGRNRELLNLLIEKPELTVVIDSVLEPSMTVDLEPSRVRYNRDLDVRPVTVVPSAIRLRFEHRAESRVPVVAELEAVPASGFTVLRPYVVSPDSVTIRGPASEVERIGRVATRRIRLEELAYPVIRDLPVELPAGSRAVSVEPTSVLVTVDVDSLAIRRIRLPVRVVGAGSDRVRASPDSADVVLRGAASAVRRQVAKLRSVDAQLSARPSGPVRVPLRVDLAETGLSVRLTPAEVTVSPTGGG